MSSPYRNEVDSLRAENTRLRAQLAARRVEHGRLALLLVVVEFFAIVALRPWLNGPSDAKFWAAVVVLAGIAIGAAISALGFRRVG